MITYRVYYIGINETEETVEIICAVDVIELIEILKEVLTYNEIKRITKIQKI